MRGSASSEDSWGTCSPGYCVTGFLYPKEESCLKQLKQSKLLNHLEAAFLPLKRGDGQLKSQKLCLSLRWPSVPAPGLDRLLASKL